MGFSRQEYWSGLPCPPPGDLPDLGVEPTSPAWRADSLRLSHQGSPLVGSLAASYFLVQRSDSLKKKKNLKLPAITLMSQEDLILHCCKY